MHRLPRLAGLAVVALICLLPAAAQAGVATQDQGAAGIISPLDGTGLAGVVPIAGTATHPDFRRYELAFAYVQNPTDTWFPVQEPSSTPVVGDVLGRWDTSPISDGLYHLRLRVYFGDGAFIEAIVSNLRIANATPVPDASPIPILAPTVGPGATASALAAVSSVTPTKPVIALPASATPRPTTVAIDPDNGPPTAAGTARINSRLVGLAFVAGIRLTLIVFLLLAAYSSIRAALRAMRR